MVFIFLISLPPNISALQYMVANKTIMGPTIHHELSILYVCVCYEKCFLFGRIRNECCQSVTRLLMYHMSTDCGASALYYYCI